MFNGVKDKYGRLRFNMACAAVTTTSPVRLDSQSNVLLFSQVQHKDVLMALVAFKSFCGRIPVGCIRILSDGTLTEADKRLLRAHLPGVEFLDLAEVRSAACPSGGTWERLLWIGRLNRDRYVVQLDSDTLAIGAMPEVGACVSEGRSFVIGTWDDQDFESMAECSEDASRHLSKKSSAPHVQELAEVAFAKLEDHQRMRYVRGCSGFAGFARGVVDIDFIEHVSTQMRTLMGDVWDNWGSEQVMSNIVVANDPRAVVLPHPKYCDCRRIRPGITAFVHFIGTCRFVGDTYRTMASREIDRLRKGGQ